MKSIKRILCALIALSMSLTVMGCTKSEDESSSHVDVVAVPDAETIESIPDGAEKELVYLGDGDLNPTGNSEKSTELSLFEQKGGSIKFNRTTFNTKYDDLATAIMSGKDIPDIFKHEWAAFPCQVLQGMYQPIDEIVDFNSDMWAAEKKTADQYELNGKHYVAPLRNKVSSLIFYDNNVISNEGLEDPYTMWQNGEWDWDTMTDLMDAYVKGAQGEDPRYGINGFYASQIIQQTGQTMVTYDKEDLTFKNNLKNPDIERAENLIYDWKKNGYVLEGWYGSARECFKANCLFYAMGDWAATGESNGPKNGENWGCVPMPSDPNNKDQLITTPEMIAYMWVKGSTKKEAVKCWFECYHAAYSDPEYLKVAKEKFMVDNPNWTDEMYDVSSTITSNDYLMICEYGYGVSAELGLASKFDPVTDRSLIKALYELVTITSEEGTQQTWSQIRNKYTATVDANIEQLNSDIKEFVKK